MRTAALLVGGLLVLGGDAAAGSKETKRVAGKATLVASVCGGGAAISPDAVARLPPPQPVGGKEFLVVAGERITTSPPVARFTTRADGTFATRLPPGKWCIFDASRRPSEPRGRSTPPPVAAPPPAPAPVPEIDAACLAAERQRCDLVLALKEDVSGANITFMQGCPEPWNQPCYRGPMPP